MRTLQTAAQIGRSLSALPTARKIGLYSQDGGQIGGFEGVEVNDNGKNSVVACVTPEYVLVQHANAAAPLLEALINTGNVDFKFTSFSTWSRAWLNVYVGDPSRDGVLLGFEIANSYDGHSTLKYGIYASAVTNTLELVGYRQVCSNGMKIRVPLDEAEIIRPEIVTRVKDLLKQKARITHVGAVSDKIKAVALVVEAVGLLRAPIAKMIELAQETELTPDEVERLIKVYVRKRWGAKVYEQLRADPRAEGKAKGEATIWGLYNAITYIASHDEKISVVNSEQLLERAADLLQHEIVVAIAERRGGN